MAMCPVHINSLNNNITKEANDSTTGILLFVYISVARLPAYAGQGTFIYYYECTCLEMFCHVTMTQLK